MCGIAGAIGFKIPLNQDTLNGLIDSLAHRGPDDSGLWTSQAAESPTIALVHRRLAIQDLSPAGHQPMRSECGRFALVFNGEIYNQHQLRNELEAQGLRFKSTSDTEVLLNLLAVYGEAALAKLRGMYAFCFWDNLEKRALVGRDPYGIKPLYYWNGPAGELLFASEVRALLKTGLISKALDVEGLAGFLQSGSIPEPHTLVRDIKSLPPGWMGSWQEGRWHQQPHWQPSFTESFPQSDSDICSLTRSWLEESAQAHLISDVPVGLFLSGGLDSTSLLALTSKAEITALSIGFNESEFDEAQRAQAIAKHYHVSHEILKLDVEAAAKLLPVFLNAVDQPSIDGFNTYSVSHLAAEKGLKVVISGLGGDELFGGYPSFQKIPQLLILHRSLGPARRTVAKALSLNRSHRQKRLAEFLRGPATPLRAHTCVRGLFSSSEADAILGLWGFKREFAVKANGEWTDSSSALASRVERIGLANTIAWIESSRYMGQQLLRDSDVYSMANGLELRIPFVDSVLLSQLSGIKASTRLAKGKKLLQDAVPELRDILPPTPKKGFALPFQLWFDQPSSPLRPGGDIYRLPAVPDGIDFAPWPRRWGLMVLRHWLDAHLDIQL